MNSILFTITPDEGSDWLIARWDDPWGGGITTEGQTVPELQAMIADAVDGYFESKGTSKAGKIESRLMMPIAFSHDRRAIDGGDAVRFTQDLRAAFAALNDESVKL